MINSIFYSNHTDKSIVYLLHYCICVHCTLPKGWNMFFLNYNQTFCSTVFAIIILKWRGTRNSSLIWMRQSFHWMCAISKEWFILNSIDSVAAASSSLIQWSSCSWVLFTYYEFRTYYSFGVLFFVSIWFWMHQLSESG